MLEIMRDSRIGTNGTIGIVLLLAFKVILLSVLDAGSMITCLLVMPVLSRNNIIIASAVSKYARETKGMGESVVNRTGVRELIIGSVITLIICIPISRYELAALLPASVLFVLIFIAYVKSKLGGITGDVIGATIEISEVAILSAAFIISAPAFAGLTSKLIY
jgi:adenosylcobinamide-GDP ribazoletransferase